jgi:uncharacterized Tic20 family protein
MEFRQMEFKPWGMSKSDFLLLLHLSQIFAGPILSYVMWESFKNQDEDINLQGKEVLNWSISSFIYVLSSIILCGVLVPFVKTFALTSGFVLTLALIICRISFPIMAALKSKDGFRFKYPLTFKFIK